MAVMKTHISWTNTTWNPTTGCTKVSAGCDNCYAEEITNRFLGGDFETVRTHPSRISQVAQFKPMLGDDGFLYPRLVFVNSMSDIFHEDISDEFRDQVFQAQVENTQTIFQNLTKRPHIMRKYVKRFFSNGVPDNIWLGTSVEDNRVTGRIRQLRAMKDDVGDFTAFLSVEPLIGPADEHDYADIEQVLIGGESGKGARDCKALWVNQSFDAARRHNSAVHMKQWGLPRNNPLVIEAMATGMKITEAFFHVVRNGQEKACEIILDQKTGKEKIEGEKGGATLNGNLYREKPPSYFRVKASLPLPAPKVKYEKLAPAKIDPQPTLI